MQFEGANRAEETRKGNADQVGDEIHVLALRSELAHKIAAHIQVEGDLITAVPGLALFRRTALTSCYTATYEPSIIIHAQGQKHVNICGAM
jgi:hypothetical protein